MINWLSLFVLVCNRKQVGSFGCGSGSALWPRSMRFNHGDRLRAALARNLLKSECNRGVKEINDCGRTYKTATTAT